MKIIYVEDRPLLVRKIIEDINISMPDFFKENKLVLLSRYPYIAEPNCIFDVNFMENLKNNNLNDSIMYISLGNLAYVFKDDIIMDQIDYGPGFDLKELITFPIRYYQEKENKKVDSVSFYYQNYYNSPYFDGSRLNEYLNELGIRNDQSLEFQNINLRDVAEKKIVDLKQRKVIFVGAETIFYDVEDGNIEKIKDVTKRYLEDGNFLVLLSSGDSQNGFPFSVDIANVNLLSNDKCAVKYRQLLSFFTSLDIDDDQVTNFKNHLTGLNFKGGSYNFGYKLDLENFYNIYLDYLKYKGYNIGDVYLFVQDKCAEWSIDKIENKYIVSSQDDFNDVVKKKVFK